MSEERAISADFPYESKYVEVLGSRIHYVEQGEGDPVLFLHGNPTSSYLWRNVIPHVAPHARCIAPDLIGMGKSDTPDIAYRFEDHFRYVEGFVDALGLERITLVVHDWGSGLGFRYAQLHEDSIRGLAFMEAIVQPVSWSQFPPDFKTGFKLLRTPGVGWLMIVAMNAFVEKILPQSIVRKLSKAEMDRYREPYPTFRSRRPIRQWPLEIPIDGMPSDVHSIVSSYGEWLTQAHLPKLLIHARPGGILRADEVAWCRESFPNLDVVDVGSGIHYLQEDHPHEIGEAVAEWYQRIADAGTTGGEDE